MPDDGGYELHPFVDDGLALDVLGREEVLALAVLLGEIHGDGAALNQGEVTVHDARHRVVGIDLKQIDIINWNQTSILIDAL